MYLVTKCYIIRLFFVLSPKKIFPVSIVGKGSAGSLPKKRWVWELRNILFGPVQKIWGSMDQLYRAQREYVEKKNNFCRITIASSETSVLVNHSRIWANFKFHIFLVEPLTCYINSWNNWLENNWTGFFFLRNGNYTNTEWCTNVSFDNRSLTAKFSSLRGCWLYRNLFELKHLSAFSLRNNKCSRKVTCWCEISLETFRIGQWELLIFWGNVC